MPSSAVRWASSAVFSSVSWVRSTSRLPLATPPSCCSRVAAVFWISSGRARLQLADQLLQGRRHELLDEAVQLSADRIGGQVQALGEGLEPGDGPLEDVLLLPLHDRLEEQDHRQTDEAEDGLVEGLGEIGGEPAQSIAQSLHAGAARGDGERAHAGREAQERAEQAQGRQDGGHRVDRPVTLIQFRPELLAHASLQVDRLLPGDEAADEPAERPAGLIDGRRQANLARLRLPERAFRDAEPNQGLKRLLLLAGVEEAEQAQGHADEEHADDQRLDGTLH